MCKMYTRPGITVLLVLLVQSISCANILFVAPLASPSHHLWDSVLARGLVNKGHNITMLSPDREKEPAPKNFTLILLEGIYDVLRDNFNFEEAIEAGAIGKMMGLYGYVKFSCEYYLNTKGLDTLLNYPKDYKFDLIIFDVTFGQCLYPLIERFHNPPAIGVTAFMLPPVLSNAFGNHQYPSYMPSPYTIHSQKMTLVERTLNFLYTNIEIFYRDYISASTEFNFYKKKFGENVSPPHVLERRMSLLLANTNPVLDYIVPLPPNIIPVGGLQIRPAKALPEDLQGIMDNAKNGVILFSLGTNLVLEDLKPFQLQALLEAFAKFPQTILWKINNDTVLGSPKNVIIRKWLPQNDILAHPNIKLFISHGGAMSTQEATYHGVPVVGVPFFMDQYANIEKLARRKLAKSLDIKTITPEDVYDAIYEILNNPIYQQNMKIISKQFSDQPETPLERAVFWIEYVLRHGGAEHLVLPARDMPFYITSNLDIMAVFALSIIVVYLLVSSIIRYCLGLSGGVDLEKKTK